MARNNQIDNLYFFMDESFERVRGDFVRKLREYKDGFLHNKGATVRLYKGLGGVVLDLLEKHERRRCETTYNLMGVITTPLNRDYGIAIPAFNEIADYCEENDVSAGFLSIHGDKHIEHYDAELRIPINRIMIERRMRNPKNFEGCDKRNGSSILTKGSTLLH